MHLLSRRFAEKGRSIELDGLGVLQPWNCRLAGVHVTAFWFWGSLNKPSHERGPSAARIVQSCVSDANVATATPLDAFPGPCLGPYPLASSAIMPSTGRKGRGQVDGTVGVQGPWMRVHWGPCVCMAVLVSTICFTIVLPLSDSCFTTCPCWGHPPPNKGKW